MKAVLFFLSALLLSTSTPTVAQGKGKGPVNTVTLDLSAAGTNDVTVTLVDLDTNIPYSISTSGTLSVPKHGTFSITLQMKNNEGSEINYQLGWNGSDYVGITLQTTEARGAGTYPIQFERDATITLTRL